MSMPLPNINLNSTLGAIFIGEVFAAALYGITSLQAFIFFRGNTRDRPLFKLLVAFLWFLDTIQLIFMTHGVYDYLIINFDNPSVLMAPTWSFLSQVAITCLSDLIVRCVFARRIWILSGHKISLLVLIITTSIAVFAMGTVFTVRGFIDGSYSRLILESWLLYTALGGSVIADGMVTASLCVLLKHSRTGFKSTDSLVNTLMLYTINTGLLTSICATACFVTFAIWPHQFIFIGIYFTLSKLYINSLLAVLNTREALRKRQSALTTIPQSPSTIESLRMNFITSSATNTSEPESPVVSKPRPSKLSWQYK